MVRRYNRSLKHQLDPFANWGIVAISNSPKYIFKPGNIHNYTIWGIFFHRKKLTLAITGFNYSFFIAKTCFFSLIFEMGTVFVYIPANNKKIKK